MNTKISTDWHVGVVRSSGTSAASQAQLKRYILSSLADCLDDSDHLVCGDLFNSFTVDSVEVLAAYAVFAAWLDEFGKKLALVRGNHDHHESNGKLSSFDLLASILQMHYPDQVVVARDVTEWKNFILVPHLPNNDLLNLAIDGLGDVAGKFVVFHANLANMFASHSDHSLDVSMAQAKSLVDRGATVLFGHEHISRRLMGEKVIVLGNSVPSSISDCLTNNFKFAHRVLDGQISTIPTWSRTGPNGYEEMDWRDLHESEAKFIRIVGSATAEEAEAVVEAVAKYRAKSGAFVVGNAVVVDGLAAMDALEEASAETIKSFDVMSALLSYLNEEEQVAVRGLV